MIGVDLGPNPPNRDHRRKPADDATLRRLATRYAEGVSIRDLSRETGWAYATVHSRLSMAQAAGLVVLRPRGSRVTG